MAYPLQGGSPVTICSGGCAVGWATNGTSIAFHFYVFGPGKTVIVPLRRGTVFPPLPVSGLESVSEAASLPGAKIIEGDARPGPDPSIYASVRATVHRNLYRIPIP